MKNYLSLNVTPVHFRDNHTAVTRGIHQDAVLFTHARKALFHAVSGQSLLGTLMAGTAIAIKALLPPASVSPPPETGGQSLTCC